MSSYRNNECESCYCMVRISVPVTNTTHIEEYNTIQYNTTHIEAPNSTKYCSTSLSLVVRLLPACVAYFISLFVPLCASCVHQWKYILKYWHNHTITTWGLLLLYYNNARHSMMLRCTLIRWSTRCQTVLFAYYESHLLFSFIISWLKSFVSCLIVINFVV